MFCSRALQTHNESASEGVDGELDVLAGSSLEWIGDAPAANVRKRLTDVTRALTDLKPLQEERRMLHERLRVLEPQLARPLK